MSEKAIYDKFVAKVNALDTSRFALKTKCNTDKSDLEKKIPDANGLIKKRDYNAKITAIQGKISSLFSLTTSVTLTAVENKIPDLTNLLNQQAMAEKYQTLNLSILQQMIHNKIPNKHLTQR